MTTPQDWLNQILEATEALLNDETLNHQQVTFVEVIRSNAEYLYGELKDLPVTAVLVHRYLPHDFHQPQTPMIGYTTLLLEHPSQFDVVKLNLLHKQHLTIVQNRLQQLRDWTYEMYQRGETERKDMYNAPPQATHLKQFLEDYVPLYQYFLKEKPIELIADIPPYLPHVMANPYHLSHLLQHVILTIADELIEEGNIHLLAMAKDNSVMITIASDALELTKEAIFTLFEQQGRHMYHEKLEAQGGKISIPSPTKITLHLTKS